MKRLLVNDYLSALANHRTFWNDLMDWFDMEFLGGEYADLAKNAGFLEWDLIVRNGSYFGPIESAAPQISLIQDIFTEGPAQKMQKEVIVSSAAVVFNSAFTESQKLAKGLINRVIPLPVDFDLFIPGNPMGLQQALSLPDGAVCWIGAAQEAAHIKGWDVFLSVVRNNPDIPFVGVFKDQQPEYGPPNLRMFTKVTHEELVKIIGACRVGLCTSRVESQHLSGIEMGACGLPMVAPPVGIYWQREDIPGTIVAEPNAASFTSAIREVRQNIQDADATQAYWKKEFDREVIREQWETLIGEVECSGVS